MDNDLFVDLVLKSLPESLKGFIEKFDMNQLEQSLPDLLNMLRVTEKGSQESKSFLRTIRQLRIRNIERGTKSKLHRRKDALCYGHS